MAPPFSSQSLSYPYVTIFCSVFLCPVPTCIHMYHHHPEFPNFSSFFLSFFLHPKHILFSPICAQTTHISTPYTLLLLSSHRSRHPHSLATTLSSYISALWTYHTLTLFLNFLFISLQLPLNAMLSLHGLVFGFGKCFYFFVCSPLSLSHLLQMYH